MFELIRNWMMLCGATLIGYDMLKYVAYIGDSLEEEVLRSAGFLLICVIAGLGEVFLLETASRVYLIYVCSGCLILCVRLSWRV